MRHIPTTGDQYKHFKGSVYEIVTIAIHSETLEEQVVYRDIRKPHDTYVRPLEMFLEEVDHTKYPEVDQQYRFQFMTEEKDEEEVDPLFLQFFEETTYVEKVKVLDAMKNRMTSQMLISMAMSTDIVLPDGELDVQRAEFRECLSMRGKFERER